MEADLVLRAVVLPAGTTVMLLVVLAAVAGRSVRRSPDGRASSAFTWLPLAAALPAVLSYAQQEGAAGLSWPPAVAFSWMWVALPLAALSTIALAATPAVVRSVLPAFLALSVVVPPGYADPGGRLFAAAIVGAASFAASSGRGARDSAGASEHVAWWLVFGIASAMALLSGFAKLSFVIASLSAAASMLALLSPWAPRLRPDGASTAASACALGVLCFLGLGYDESGFPWWSWALLACAPAGLAVRVFAWGSPRARSLAVIAVPTLLALVALVLALGWTGALARFGQPAEPDRDVYGLRTEP
ncbi:MAG: hypothetical protein ACKOFI_03645 [Phycisphaerales bacterium]